MPTLLKNIYDVELAESPIHGKGLFTTRTRKKGEILTILDGQAVPHGEDINFLLAHEWNAISPDEILLRPVWTLYGYINHAKPSLLSFRLLDRSLFLTQDVKAGEELTIDYLEYGIPQIYLNSEHGSYLR